MEEECQLPTPEIKEELAGLIEDEGIIFNKKESMMIADKVMQPPPLLGGGCNNVVQQTAARWLIIVLGAFIIFTIWEIIKLLKKLLIDPRKKIIYEEYCNKNCPITNRIFCSHRECENFTLQLFSC